MFLFLDSEQLSVQMANHFALFKVRSDSELLKSVNCFAIFNLPNCNLASGATLVVTLPRLHSNFGRATFEWQAGRRVILTGCLCL